MRLSAIVLLLFSSAAAADELRLDARRPFEEGTNQHLRLFQGAVELDRGELIEDDGPAAGFSYQPNEEKLSANVWIKKELILADPRAKQATLLVAPGGKLQFQVNGKAIEPTRAGKTGNYWEAYTLPADCLRAGQNEIVLHGGGRVWIARAEDFAAGSTERKTHPQRSARSSDGGKTWDTDKLGAAGSIRGEYCVRLFLDHHSTKGSLTTAVIDAGNLAGLPIGGPVGEIGPIRLALDADMPAGGRVRLLARSGTTVDPAVAHASGSDWSDWQEVKEAVAKPVGRFVQVRLELSTGNPLVTPRLKELTLQASPKRSADWTKEIKVVEAKNESIVRTSIPFRYEPFDQPRLKQLREQYRLDEVVKGVRDDLERAGKLAAWTARQWDQGHLKEIYPAWDALAILRPHTDGKPVGGFCQQYNLVLLQACASFGLPGRAVSISTGDHQRMPGSGHEVVEIWSNEHKKWIYIDGNTAWYLVDAESGVPLSLWELRQRQLAAAKGTPGKAVRAVTLAQTKHEWKGLEDWPPFLELRLIPRSNFLEEKSPLPLNQGMRGWFWTGHQVWSDAESPASPIYSQRVNRSGDWNWTLNQAHYVLEALDQPGQVRVHLDTVTPGVATFLAAIDGQPAQPVKSGFVWKLHPGRNELQVRPRNQAGVDGVPSSIAMEYR